MPAIPPLPNEIDKFNEADVRAEILDPLLAYLGYGASTPNNIRREQSISLRYPNSFLGRKNPQNDPPLRGKPDYILEVGDKRRWVLEAKPATADLTHDDVEQAYTYANHPEIAGVIFVLSNGKTLSVYDSKSPPSSPPIYSVEYPNLRAELGMVASLLSPDSIERRFPKVDVRGNNDVDIIPGFRSPIQILAGFATTERPTRLNLSILDGAIERSETGLLVYVNLVSPLASLQKQNERLGLDRFEARSLDKTISTDPTKLTVFTTLENITLPKGFTFFDFDSGRYTTLPLQSSLTVNTRITGYFDGKMLVATIYSEMSLLGLPQPILLTLTSTTRLRIR